jgi:hypothetical protein
VAHPLTVAVDEVRVRELAAEAWRMVVPAEVAVAHLGG